MNIGLKIVLHYKSVFQTKPNHFIYTVRVALQFHNQTFCMNLGVRCACHIFVN